MNRNQNIVRKKYKDRISELEVEVSLLRQKLEIIGNVLGGVQVNKSPVLIDNKGFENEKGRVIATVWKVDKDIYFQTNNEEERKYLESIIEKKKVATGSEVKEEVKKKEESIIDHLKR